MLMITGGAGYASFFTYNYLSDSNARCKVFFTELQLPKRKEQPPLLSGYVDINLDTRALTVALDANNGEHIGRRALFTPHYGWNGKVKSITVDKLVILSQETTELGNDYGFLLQGNTYPLNLKKIDANTYLYQVGPAVVFCQKPE